jgi:quinol monooxygenase YgiN
MAINRRDFILTTSALAFTTICPAQTQTTGHNNMYGLISKLAAIPGQRDTLIAILIEGVSGMPGCLSYVVAKDATESDSIWITEVWDKQESHEASLKMPSVQKAIGLGKPLISGFRERFVSQPVGGFGLR